MTKLPFRACNTAHSAGRQHTPVKTHPSPAVTRAVGAQHSQPQVSITLGYPFMQTLGSICNTQRAAALLLSWLAATCAPCAAPTAEPADLGASMASPEDLRVLRELQAKPENKVGAFGKRGELALAGKGRPGPAADCGLEPAGHARPGKASR